MTTKTTKTKCPRGLYLCIRLMGLCKESPLTAADAATKTGHGQRTCAIWLRGLELIGRLHVVDWVQCNVKGPRAAVWAYGAGASTLPPCGRRPSRRVSMANLGSLRVIMDCLQDPCSRQELAEVSGMSPATINPVLRALRREKLVRVWGHDRAVGATGPHYELFRLGSGPDAPRPAARPMVECQRAYYYRQKGLRAITRGVGDVIHAALAQQPVFEEAA
jgi:hypothetical protein